jgi:hypothetical protein
MRTIVIGGMGVAVAVAVAAMLGVTETLPSNVLLALTAVEEDTREGFMIVCTWRVPDTVQGMRFVLLGLLLGGVPAAILAALLRRTRANGQWSAEWGNVFRAGFVFQLNSLMLTTCVFCLVFVSAYSFADDRLALVATGEALLVSIACSIWGLRSWRALHLQVRELPMTLRWVEADEIGR